MYLEGMEEASVFVHIAVNDVTGKVGKAEFTQAQKRICSVACEGRGLAYLGG